MSGQQEVTVKPYNPQALAQSLLESGGPLLLYGETGVGKSSLAKYLAKSLTNTDHSVYCLNCDPGSPAFGIPGAVTLGRWHKNSSSTQGEHFGWKLMDVEPICSLDAVRYRLPLVTAARHLLNRHRTTIKGRVLLIDVPGVNDTPGEELLAALLAQVPCRRLCYLVAENKKGSFQVSPEETARALTSQSLLVDVMWRDPEAVRPNKTQRARWRSELWQTLMKGAREYQVSLTGVGLLGVANELQRNRFWTGRQLALLKDGRAIAMGEVLERNTEGLAIRVFSTPQLKSPCDPAKCIESGAVDGILVRDAVVSSDGILHTEHLREVAGVQRTRSGVSLFTGGYNPNNPRTGDPITVNLGGATATMLNGVFGDPLLHLQLHNQRRHLLFDLGEAGRLPTKVIHQTSDIFLSHTHADHIGGFLWFLRSRIGYYPQCRIYGPPGIARQILGLINGLLWDRVEDRAPRFEVAEFERLDKTTYQLQRWVLEAGKVTLQPLPPMNIEDGLIVEEPAFSVRARVLEHGMNGQSTPVLAYALELSPRFNVSKERLAAFGVSPGPWLQTLKHSLEAGNKQAVIHLPNGRDESIESLSEQLLISGAGEKLVYATDLADSAENRATLIPLAQSADVLFCEAPFRAADQVLAQCNGHLTTVACGEIASEAKVKTLVPFHFSKRYEKEPNAVYDEIHKACSLWSRHQHQGVFSTVFGG